MSLSRSTLNTLPLSNTSCVKTPVLPDPAVIVSVNELSGDADVGAALDVNVQYWVSNSTTFPGSDPFKLYPSKIPTSCEKYRLLFFSNSMNDQIAPSSPGIKSTHSIILKIDPPSEPTAVSSNEKSLGNRSIFIGSASTNSHSVEEP